ncbi:TetR/AcrR family transcriptional regulator [Aeromicrobium duanguangcaii]|uniref:TetR/AcrR family transcriptional regulator n=1 Tax=Aeromicrobium duanguangcaii TaxID=2968086 RepID=A0ABY5KHC3_9ACTN|nr:TetR/AcrR family transcriptional regulator [Aeromicrobium duanguangcaii]MCD9153196.1 TetR/AcrR family transcriptional regulator [Aeromicrobium duanguangcaii]UUI69704.1 TetR/AcrR family transcriptional regulator [Aeromicrobium duanguangcaii]
MQTETVSPLVAERQRQTWTAIHHAASAATREHGPDEVTVAQIAAAAGISPRTFFNYFDSKEDAIVGVRAPRITEDAVQMLRDSRDEPALLRVSKLVTEVAASTIGPGVDLVQRRALAASHPRLRARLSQVFTDSRKLVIARMIEDTEPPWLGIEGLPTDPIEAHALVLLAGAVVTLTWTGDPDFFHTDRDAALICAITIFRKVTSTAL